MTYDAKKLTELLPAVLRPRDVKAPDKERVLDELIRLLAEQVEDLEENVQQLYDDQFIETCAGWAVPYIADLVGCRILDEKVPGLDGGRAEVANTIRYRRRKGTASMLEQLAHDVTGWDARVVEFFERLATTQHMNHVRPESLALASLRSAAAIEMLPTPFDPFAHAGEVRAIASRRGKYNIPNIGIFLWRLKACPVTGSPARPASVSGTPDKRRFFFSPLGHDLPLVTRPQAEEEISHLAEPLNVPLPIGRRRLLDHPEDYYGPSASFWVKGIDSAAKIVVADLSDRSSADDWGPAPPAGFVAVDPALGRLIFGDDKADPPLVTFCHGFGADMGGGEYDRLSSFHSEITKVIQVPDDQPTIQKALDALADEDTIIEITDNGLYRETLAKTLPAGRTIEIRAANEKRPLVELQAPFEVKGAGADLTLNGLLVSGRRIIAADKVKALRVRHCTLVPGLALKPSGVPEKPDQPSLEVKSETAELEVGHSITGGVRLTGEGKCTFADSILDATSESGVALAAGDGAGAAGVARIIRTTVIGKVHVIFLKLACNAIFDSVVTTGDGWAAPVISQKLQDGCVRFSFVPWPSRVPRKHRCRPETIEEAARIWPRFTTLRYGRPGYAQLHWRCPCVLRRGADDESEMGAFHDLYAPQREANLRLRLDEYLRFGLEAGIFYAS